MMSIVANNAPPLMLPPRKCAEALGVPEYTVRQWLVTGYIKGVPCGRKRLINVDALRRKLAET
jgi:excisionase family DNA binding protein